MNSKKGYQFANQLNITSIENLIRENSQKRKFNKIMTIYYIISKIIIVFKEMNTYLASIFRK